MNDPGYSRRAAAALLLSSDPLGAALLGAAVELAGYRASFPRPGELASDALRRLRPRVVLVDAADALLDDVSVMGPAMMTGAQVILFGAAQRVRDLAILADRYGVRVVTLPDDVERLPALLGRASDADVRGRAD